MCLLQTRKLSKNIARVSGKMVLHVSEHILHLRFGRNDIRLAVGKLSNEAEVDEGSVLARDDAALIRKQGEVEAVALLEVQMLVNAVHGDANNLHTKIVVLLDVLLEALCFDGASIGKVSRIEVEHGTLSGQIFKANILPRVGWKGEVGCGGSNQWNGICQHGRAREEGKRYE